MSDAQSNLIELSAEIVASYVANNSVPATDIASLISNVHAALINASTANVSELTAERTPAVPIKKSIRPDSIICLEDGRAFKSLKRHLRTKYDLSPEEYRTKWGLASDYPMVAPNYAAARSRLAKNMGLGQQRRKKAEAVPIVKAPTKKRARSKVDA